MGKLYWTLVVLTIVVGLGVAITFGLKGKTVPKIKWSHFADSQEVSDALQLRLSQEFKAYKMVFVGPHPEKAMHVEASVKWISWLRNQGNSILVVDPRLLQKQVIVHDIVLDLMKEPSRFLEGLQQVPSGTRVIVWAPNIFVTHLLSGSPVNQMQNALKDWDYGVLSFTTFPAGHEKEKDFELPCYTGEGDSSGFSELGCFVRHQARPHYRKKSIEGKTAGFLNQVRTREYMFFLGDE